MRNPPDPRSTSRSGPTARLRACPGRCAHCTGDRRSRAACRPRPSRSAAGRALLASASAGRLPLEFRPEPHDEPVGVAGGVPVLPARLVAPFVDPIQRAAQVGTGGLERVIDRRPVSSRRVAERGITHLRADQRHPPRPSPTQCRAQIANPKERQCCWSYAGL
jgi:hypothetical protein